MSTILSMPGAEPAIILEIEQETLGTLLLGGAGREALTFLRDYHFTEAFHAAIFRAIQTAYEKYGTANTIYVKQLLIRIAIENFEAQTGRKVSDYLASLTSMAVATGQAALERARMVVEQWGRISVVNEAVRASMAASDAGADVGTIVHDTARKLDDIMSEVKAGMRKRSRISIGSAVELAVNAASEARQRPGGLTGITWGLADINRLTGGMQKRDLTLIGARPSMGKTSVAVSVAIKAAKAGAGIGFFSLEMDSEKIGARAASDMLYDWRVKIPYVDIIRGNVTDSQMDYLGQAVADIERLPIWIDDQSSPTVTDIRVRTEKMMDAARRDGKPFDAVIIDHLGLIKPSSRYQGNRTNEIGEMTSSLKAMARDLDIAVVLLSQLNRAVESRAEKVPQLSDLRDSGSIEQDADMIAFLYREAYYLGRETGGSAEEQMARADKLADCQNKLEFHISKQRNGPLAKVDLFAEMSCSAIRNWSQQ